MALAVFGGQQVVWEGQAATWGPVEVVPPPASLEDRFTYWQRKSQVMPTPTLDDRGLPT